MSFDLEAKVKEHDEELERHDERIRSLEEDRAIMKTQIGNIVYWVRWGVGLIAGTFLVELIRLVKGT